VIRLHITVEGQTEERFVKDVLAPHLGRHGVFADARRVLTSRDKRSDQQFRGGFRRTNAYVIARGDICTWMKEDRGADVRFTTMFDLYALPKDFPGQNEAARATDPYERVAVLEQELRDDIHKSSSDSRFVPYIQLHEFEALVLADPKQLKWEFMEHERQIQRLLEMVAREGGNPELIDDGHATAPSKRIIAEVPEYEGTKASSGPLVVEKIGIEALRVTCRHFEQWLSCLERL
jgi:hypothetical protein